MTLVAIFALPGLAGLALWLLGPSARASRLLTLSFGGMLLLVDIPLLVRFFYRWISMGTVPPITAMAIMFCTIVGLQSLLFAMLFDMQANRDLKGD